MQDFFKTATPLGNRWQCAVRQTERYQRSGRTTVMEQPENAFGPVNVLVNNAGITMITSILQMTEEGRH
ncbi:hypothetical protein [Planococcus shenhongbingii]|uniref:Uncharacterized protein n=1 Tax=Planococcus shenhongbingii TaxID=3058398 RepID=A0ABT8NBT0_9BACL|nr:hypothetical protein [Planococcus sp. N017]MDN7245164.1 hypothetical protein [Planococcus sp. N017]